MMNKNDDILDRMLAKTRKIPPDDRVPYAFEKRIMAHIKEAPVAGANLWELWGLSLWRAVVPCLAVMVLVAVWMNTAGEAAGTSGPKTGTPTVVTIDSPPKADLESIVMFAIDPQPGE
jgi:hypothetical protein